MSLEAAHLRIPTILQPNSYTCGAACIAMVAEAVTTAAAPDVGLIASLAGTNPATGTTEIEMGRGLSKMGLSYRRGDATTVEGLRAEMRSGRIVVLRTLVHGCKHWVVVAGANDDGSFEINCPSSGRLRWSSPVVSQVWGARDFDHFLVPAIQEDRSESTKPPLHERTFCDFIGSASEVTPESLFSNFEVDAIDATSRYMSRAKLDPVYELPIDHPGLRFFRAPPFVTARERKSKAGYDHGISAMVVTGREFASTPVAGIYHGTPYVLPPHRGRGIGREMVIAALFDRPHRYLMPFAFSEAGLAVRVAIHREAIEDALSSGMAVSERVIASNPSLNPSAHVPLRRRSAGLVEAPAARAEVVAAVMKIEQEQRTLSFDNGG